MARILFVDDDSDFTAAILILLRPEGHEVHVAGSLKEARDALDHHPFDFLFVDLLLPDGNGLELVKEQGPRAIVITGHPCMQSAIRAVRGKAVDYLVKPVDKSQLLRSIEAVDAGYEAKSTGIDKGGLRTVPGHGLHGESAAMRKVLDKISDYATTDVTVLITGESGTGKELVARALHDARNPDTPFIALNCGVIPQELISSELFGHEKGSFTGAASQRKGLFERAAEGTVFLDEVGELPLLQQTALLRVIETRTVQRVGGEREIKVTPRIIAATNRDLAQEVGKGNFREDLFYRLNVLTIHIPPLRERVGDIELLAKDFLTQYAAEHHGPTAFSPAAMERLERYYWPGNVRELKHTVLKASILNRGKDLVDELPEDFEQPPNWLMDADNLRPGMSIREAERRLIEKTLLHFGGNKRMTAETLGVSLKTLYNRLREYEDRTEDC